MFLTPNTLDRRLGFDLPFFRKGDCLAKLWVTQRVIHERSRGNYRVNI